MARELLIPFLLWSVLFPASVYLIKRSRSVLLYGLAIAIPTVILAYASSYYFPWLMVLIPLFLILVSIKFGFIWRATGVSYIGLLVSFFIFFLFTLGQAGGFYCQMEIQKIDSCEDYVELTKDELNEYKLLKRAISKCEGEETIYCTFNLKASNEERDKTLKLLSGKETNKFKVNGHCYEIVDVVCQLAGD
ncbi:MAG: hypothetical protein R6U44_05080 [Archaeoglobaceae archaeon]